MSLDNMQDCKSFEEMRLPSADFIGASRETLQQKAECKTATVTSMPAHKSYLAKREASM
jgi:hypothetical protein